MRKYLHRTCPSCNESDISIFSVSDTFSAGKAYCKSCGFRFTVSVGNKWLVAFCSAMFVPLLLIFFVLLGFVKGILSLFIFMAVAYYLILIKVPLIKTEQSIV